jgi:hypothetical protein
MRAPLPRHMREITYLHHLGLGREFCGRTLQKALAWCLVWLMRRLGTGRFLV